MEKQHFLFTLLLLFFFVRPCFGQLIINEVYADVAISLIGDANGDEIRNAREDEFIELFNSGENEVDLSHLKLS